MNDHGYQTIASNPKFKELVQSRTSFAWTLTFLMLAAYTSFILLVAFAPGFLATPLYEGSIATVGIPIGIGVIVFAFILTGIYVARANGHYDDMTAELVKDLTK